MPAKKPKIVFLRANSLQVAPPHFASPELGVVDPSPQSAVDLKANSLRLSTWLIGKPLVEGFVDPVVRMKANPLTLDHSVTLPRFGSQPVASPVINMSANSLQLKPMTIGKPVVGATHA